MKKKIKKYGDSFVIIFGREDRDLYDIKAGDIVYIDESQFTISPKYLKKIEEECEKENS